MNCKEALDLAEEAMDKDLPRAVKHRLDLHLSRCESCRRFFAAERAEHVRWFRIFNDPLGGVSALSPSRLLVPYPALAEEGGVPCAAPFGCGLCGGCRKAETGGIYWSD